MLTDSNNFPTFRGTGVGAQLLGVGTAHPERYYRQEELLDAFEMSDRKIRSIFLNGGIGGRYLELDSSHVGKDSVPENQKNLLDKHKTTGLRIGRDAIDKCLDSVGRSRDEIEFLCCVTSTGILIPGFSALLITEMGLKSSCQRLDVVGMGCNAGLNGLAAVASWSNSNPGSMAILVCIEVCSAMYIYDEQIGNAVVNSLFGDGAAACAVENTAEREHNNPNIVKFSSHIITDELYAMRSEWDSDHGKFRFCLDPAIPYVIGANANVAIDRLLAKEDISVNDIDHWVVHSGGRKVIDGVRMNLGLSKHDLRHTISVLHDFGNLSSSSFMFSYQRLLNESKAKPSDIGMMMTMGPGSTIELALLRW